MIKRRIVSIAGLLKKFMQRRFGSIIEINRRYRQPRIKMTPATRVLLLLLRIYLILLVLILFYKFFTIITGG